MPYICTGLRLTRVSQLADPLRHLIRGRGADTRNPRETTNIGLRPMPTRAWNQIWDDKLKMSDRHNVLSAFIAARSNTPSTTRHIREEARPCPSGWRHRSITNRSAAIEGLVVGAC